MFVSHRINNLFILIQSLLIMHFRVLSPPGYEPFFSNTVATSSYSSSNNNNNSKNCACDANEKLLGSPSQVLPLPGSSKDLQLPIDISNEVRWLRLTQPPSIMQSFVCGFVISAFGAQAENLLQNLKNNRSWKK